MLGRRRRGGTGQTSHTRGFWIIVKHLPLLEWLLLSFAPWRILTRPLWDRLAAFVLPSWHMPSSGGLLAGTDWQD